MRCVECAQERWSGLWCVPRSVCPGALEGCVVYGVWPVPVVCGQWFGGAVDCGLAEGDETGQVTGWLWLKGVHRRGRVGARLSLRWCLAV